MNKKINNSGLKYRADNDPRAAALLVIGEVLQEGGNAPDSQVALDKQLREATLTPSDAALLTELVYGVLRLHLRLRWFLTQKLPKPEKLPPEMLLILELAAYELAHTRIPAHAGVHWAVDFLRNRFGQGLAKVGNGVLRAFQRGLDSEYHNPEYYAARLGLEDFTSASFLSVYYAVPLWIAELWLQAYGPEVAKQFLEAGISVPPYGLRINAARLGWRQLLHEFKQEAEAIPVGPAGVSLNGRSTRPGRPLKALLAEGLVSRQSAAAYEVLWALQPEAWQAPLWDACAGRGGKSLALLEQGIAVSCLSDASSGRLRGFDTEFTRLFGPVNSDNNGVGTGGALSLPNQVGAGGALPRPIRPELIFTKAEEVAKNVTADKKFASILLDVPCSGLGTLAHRPEIRWRRKPEDLDKLLAAQQAILEAARAALLPGGRIIYLTCTLNPAENERQISAFLQKHPEFTQEQIWQSAADSPLREFFWGCVLWLSA